MFLSVPTEFARAKGNVVHSAIASPTTFMSNSKEAVCGFCLIHLALLLYRKLFGGRSEAD